MNEITIYRVVSERRWDVFLAWARRLRQSPKPSVVPTKPAVDEKARERETQLWKDRVWDSEFFAQGY